MPDENEVDPNSLGVHEEELDKLEGEDCSLLLEPLNDPACLTGDIFLDGDPSPPLCLDVDLFLSMEWVITLDPFPVYNLSPMDMVITICVSVMPSSSSQNSRDTGNSSLGVAAARPPF